MTTGIICALELLQGEVKDAFLKTDAKALETVNEIRLRNGRYVTVTSGSQDMLVSADGGFTEHPGRAIVSESADIEFAFKTAFSYSLHSYSKELAQGYITTKGGNRVGICGTAVTGTNAGHEVDTIKYVSSINIRIAREKRGCAEKLYKTCLQSGASNILIIGPPSSGKTTLLRDVARLLGSHMKISLIDEQNEISFTFRNQAQNDVGSLTDVFVGYPKHTGISTAVRVMSPRAIIADEIGSDEDLEALRYAVHSGVKLITAIHGTSYNEALKKRIVRELADENVFDYAVELMPGYGYNIIKIV